MIQRKKEEVEKGILERGKDFVREKEIESGILGEEEIRGKGIDIEIQEREKGKGIHQGIKKDPEIPTDNP